MESAGPDMSVDKVALVMCHHDNVRPTLGRSRMLSTRTSEVRIVNVDVHLSGDHFVGDWYVRTEFPRTIVRFRHL